MQSPPQSAGAKLYLDEVVDSGILSGMRVSKPRGGKFLQLLEGEFRDMFGVPHAVGVNSATSGLHCALVGCGVGPGDVVMVSGVTMTASAAAVVHARATPVFADVSPHTGLCSQEHWQEAFDYAAATLDKVPKAAVVVHLLGQVAEIGELASQFKVVEDTAQAPWCASEAGALAGTMGNVGVFSLNQDKIIQCGEGGMCITSDELIASKMRLLRNHGENFSTSVCGFNYRMTELQAAFAYHEIAQLAQRQTDRVRWGSYLAGALEESERYVPMDVSNPPYYFFCLDMERGAVGAPEGWRRGYSPPLCCTPYFKHHFKQSCLVGAHEFNARLICVKAPATQEEADKLATAVLGTS